MFCHWAYLFTSSFYTRSLWSLMCTISHATKAKVTDVEKSAFKVFVSHSFGSVVLQFNFNNLLNKQQQRNHAYVQMKCKTFIVQSTTYKRMVWIDQMHMYILKQLEASKKCRNLPSLVQLIRQIYLEVMKNWYKSNDLQ